ncbi:MAG: NAD(P)-binding domain-containing protein [Trueperaceae bacterium]|nr:NAD(P)-binding domain-containing protein [Trueperaceae bacterium]
MEGLTLVGVSHRRGGGEALEAYGRAYADAPVEARLADLGVEAYLVLATCNRVDVIVHRPEGVGPEDVRDVLTPAGAPRRPYLYDGEAAFEQLARIAASLDALNPGEDQVMRQVRDAAKAARHTKRVDATLSFAIDAALRVAKAVRREVTLAPRDTSLYSLARPAVDAHLDATSAPTLALLGAGDMAHVVARALPARDDLRVVVINRTASRAEALADALRPRVGAVRALTLEDARTAPPAADVLVAATGGGLQVDAAWLDAAPATRLLVDLGMPRAVDAVAGRARDRTVVDVDTLEREGAARRAELEAHLADAERVLRTGVDAEMAAWAEARLGPAIRAMTAWLRETLEGEVDDATAATLARRLAHVPVKGLRAVAREHGVDAARTFLAETGLADDDASPETATGDDGAAANADEGDDATRTAVLTRGAA